MFGCPMPRGRLGQRDGVSGTDGRLDIDEQTRAAARDALDGQGSTEVVDAFPNADQSSVTRQAEAPECLATS